MRFIPVSLRKLIEKLYYERYMGALIYGETDIGKTLYLKKFMEKHNDLSILYIDVQETISNQKDTEIVFELAPKYFLEKWLLPMFSRKKYNAVIIDNFDVLVNLWDNLKKTEFITRIQKTEKAVYSIPVIAVLQEEDLFDEAYEQQMKTDLQRIIKFSELEEL